MVTSLSPSYFMSLDGGQDPCSGPRRQYLSVVDYQKFSFHHQSIPMKLSMASARVLGGGIIQYWLKICHVKKQHSAEGEKAFAAPTFLKKRNPLTQRAPWP